MLRYTGHSLRALDSPAIAHLQTAHEDSRRESITGFVPPSLLSMQGTDALGGISPGILYQYEYTTHTEITFRIAAVQIRCAILSRNHLPASTHALIASCSLHLSIADHAKLAILCDRVCGRGGAFLVNHADRLDCRFQISLKVRPASHLCADFSHRE